MKSNQYSIPSVAVKLTSADAKNGGTFGSGFGGGGLRTSGCFLTRPSRVFTVKMTVAGSRLRSRVDANARASSSTS